MNRALPQVLPQVLPLSLSLLLAACAIGPGYHAATPASLAVPGHYSAETGALDPADLARWWGRFNDPALDRLVERALAGNLDLAQAEARLRQAREAAIQAGAQLLPAAGASGSGGRNFDRLAGNSDRYSLSLDASWQLDLFGGLRRGAESARASERQSRYNLAAVKTALVAELARDYVTLRLQQEQLRVAKASTANQLDNRNIAGWRVEAGLASSLDEQQANAQLAQTEATIPALEAQIRTSLNQIALLLGAAPGEATAMLEAPATIPEPPAGVAVGIPADTLRQRPDVQAAEQGLVAATADVGVAEAALLPSLSISGTIGTAASTTGALFDLVTGSVFGNVSQTIFRGGALLSQVRARKAAVDGAFAAYRQSVLQALGDVENALAADRSARGREGQLKIAAEAANNSAILARAQYQAGLTDFQTLLLAEQSLLSANNALAGGRADRSLAVVQLYNALGGGWQNEGNPDG